MFEILAARSLASDVRWFRIRAPLVAKHRKPGQFLILRLDDEGERIPLTIADADPVRGTIELIVKAVGKTTHALCEMTQGDRIRDVVGPLGRPTEILVGVHAVVVGGGVGTAVVYPLAQALRNARSFVSAIIGGRTKELVVLENELAQVSDRLYPCTDDGSYGFHGTVADRLDALIGETERPIDVVYAAGPVPMMAAIAELTRARGIRTIVSLNPIMVDGTGMCGGCRVSVGGQARFACVDGPEFDGHQVDFRELADRLTAYRALERVAMERYSHECQAMPLAEVST
ncbi:MAG: sulfide/dihydroorotate dehydrogenase-like FAD/NAD-binding protein [Phycisphaerae bacterium]|jgi:ferredoxin--NADP+ reductase